MASGPEHYRKAEELLAQLFDVDRGDPNELGIIAEAQVHATLALTAATAEEGYAWWAVLLDAPAVAYDPEDPNSPRDGG